MSVPDWQWKLLFKSPPKVTAYRMQVYAKRGAFTWENGIFLSNRGVWVFLHERSYHGDDFQVLDYRGLKKKYGVALIEFSNEEIVPIQILEDMKTIRTVVQGRKVILNFKRMAGDDWW